MAQQRVAIESVPFHRPLLGSEEAAAVSRALMDYQLTGDGPISRRVEQRLADFLEIPHVLLTPSCTSALELAFLTLGVGSGAEIILPSFTFVSCATAIVRSGATPVFVDVDPQTLMIDPAQVQAAVTPRTRAILCVHYGGFPCDLRGLQTIAARHGFMLVEDAAQAVGSQLDGQRLGTFGTIGCLSFHGTKNITCGEGGAFLTRDDRIARQARLIREKGTNREAFLQREVDRYTWVETGSSFVLSDLLAAVLDVQLDRLPAIVRAQQAIGKRYLEALTPLARAGRFQLPRIEDPDTVNWHTFYLLTTTAKERGTLMRHLYEAGIDARFHFVPLHSSPYARQHYGYRPEDLPVAEDVAQRVIRLPIYPGLTSGAQDAVIDAVQGFFA